MEEKEQFDIAMLDAEYAVISGNSYLKTPSGKLVSHRNVRLIQHIIRHLSLPQKTYQQISPYEIFSLISDYQNTIDDFLKSYLLDLISKDPIIKLRKLKTEEPFQVDNLLEEMEKNINLLNLIFIGSSIIFKGFNELLIENDLQPNYEADTEEFYKKFSDLFNSFSLEKKACLLLLSHIHKSGIFLPLMLLEDKICTEEYANALFSINFYSRILCEEHLDDKSFYETASPFPEIELDFDNATFFETVNSSAKTIKDYIFFLKSNVNENSTLNQLIKQGESTYLEFKSTLRWNLRTNKKDVAIEHANLKTITAFLNSSGGTLLIGVRDDGSIEGIETDAFTDNDKFLLHLWNLIKSYLGQEFCPFIDTKLETYGNRTVCIVRCLPSNRPAFLRQTGFEEEFYIRTGPSSSKLGISDALKYISDRFEIKKF